VKIRRTGWRIVFRLALLAATIVPGSALGGEPDGAIKASQESDNARVQVDNVLSLSLAVQAPLSLDKELPLGTGIAYRREYFVARRTALGIAAGLRVFPASPFHLALGYGLSFKHYVGSLGNAGARSGLYLLYGLLMQMNYLSGRRGVPTGHDTLLSIGYDWQAGSIMPVVEVGYHLTQVRGFDQDTIWLAYSELNLGLRF
jgi:hypothetical protein